MRVWLPLYARREGGLHHLVTLGLGALGRTGRGRHPARVKRTIADQIQKELRDRPATAMRLFERRPGMKLQRLRLELKLGRGRKRSGLFPLVTERLPTAEPTIIAYHPLRQDEVLLSTPSTFIVDAARHFSHVWGSLDDEALKALETDGKDRLEGFATNLHPVDLLDTLPERDKSVFEDLEAASRERGVERRRVPRRGVPPILRELGEDWTAAAADETLHLGRPRERWREQLTQLLCVDQPRPLVLIGPAGVGKRTLLRRATDDLLQHDGFISHRNLDDVRHVIELTGSRLIAGMSYIGDWEKRCAEILEAAGGGRFLLLFQDLHTLGRVGQSRDSTRSVADFFRGPLARRELIMLGTTTDSQWKRLEEDAPGFAAGFTTLRVEPATRVETTRMMLHEVARIERATQIVYPAELLFDIVDLGAPLLQGALPGAALDLVAELAKGMESAGAITLDTEMLLDTLEAKTGLAADLFEPDAPLPRSEVVDFLATRVMGQPRALDAVADLVLRVRAGMTDPERPLGTYLFTGPTGTGKTELAKALTEFLFPDDPERLVRFDMGELSGPDAPARLAGDRFEPRGLLTEAVRRRPFCVLLLDEIEKAHPSVLHLLLQILEDGRLTDAAGDRADFRNAVVVMTSNLGARARPSVGFGESARSGELDVARAVREFFPPELFNRIDRVVPFSPLDYETAEGIAVKELANLLGRRGLTERNVFVSTSRSAAERMAHEAFDPRAGARSVRRYLERTIAPVLADHLASTVRPELELVRIRHEPERGYVLDAEPLVEAEPRPGRSSLEHLVDGRAVEIARALPRALEWLDEVESSGALASLSQRISSHLSRFEARGRASDADAIVQLDQLRSELARFREHVEAFVHYEERRQEAQHILDAENRRRRRRPRSERDDRESPRAHLLHPRWMLPPMPRQDAREMLAALAEVAFLRKLLAAPLASPWRVTLHLRVLGDANASFVGLSQALRRHYAMQRGGLESVAFMLAGGPVERELSAFDATARDVAITLVGLGLDMLWGDEDGCHVWTTTHGLSEVVRVRVVPDRTAMEVLEEHAAARAVYEEGGIDRTGGLGAAVRRIHYDGMLSGTVSQPLTIEDYRLGHVYERATRNVLDGLDALLWLRMAWESEGSE